MTNEILLLINLIIIFSGVILFYYFFGKVGLFCWTVLATVAANIEVLVLIDAFGVEQTLGNIIFASTFIVTDILSEVYGKEDSKKAVHIGISVSFAFILISQFWLLFTPTANDWAMPHIKSIFSNTPRLMFASFAVYAIAQRFDVWAYHACWNLTTKLGEDKKKYLWIRNNASTLISQLLNAILFTFAAFYGVFDLPVLLEIAFSTYIIYIITSAADTPFVYIARKIKPRMP